MMAEVDFTLYLVTDRRQIPGGDLLAALREALEGGVRAVQLREKDLSDREIFELGCRVRTLTRGYGAKLFINDRADIAVAVEADGVHLTQKSYSAKEARRIVGESGRIGVSVHSLRQARSAEEEGADFLTFGPVFDTPSKRMYGPPVGADRLRQATETVRIPVFAIGGIREERISVVMDSGAYGIALISGILAEQDVRAAAGKYLSRIDRKEG